VWRKAAVKNLLAKNPKVRGMLENHHWAIMFRYANWYAGRVLEQVQKLLPADHMIVKLFATHIQAAQEEEAMDKEERENILTIYEDIGLEGTPRVIRSYNNDHSRIENPVWEADKVLAAVFNRYPLLDPHNSGPDFRVFLHHYDDARAKWVEYINLIDRTQP
jgi:hypothetical protein